MSPDPTLAPLLTQTLVEALAGAGLINASGFGTQTAFAWGVGAGTTMTMGRIIVQIAAKPSHRARVLAFYQLGFSGGAPIGSLVMGFLVGGLGVHQAVLVPAGIMVLIIAGLFISPLWHYRADEV